MRMVKFQKTKRAPSLAPARRERHRGRDRVVGRGRKVVHSWQRVPQATCDSRISFPVDTTPPTDCRRAPRRRYRFRRSPRRHRRRRRGARLRVPR